MSLKTFWEKRFGPKGPRFECHLRELREEAGLTQEEVANHCQVSVETIKLIEEARYEPSVVLAEHLARFLNTTIESIFTAHPPKAPFSAGFEERLRSENRRIGAWCFFILLALSLIGANVLFHITAEQDAGIVLFFLWAIGDVSYLIGVSLVPGFWRFTRQRNREQSSNRIILYRVAGGAILYASLMMFSSNYTRTWQRGIISFLFLAITFGGAMYWITYRKSKNKSQ